MDSCQQKDFELVKDIGLKETGILVSCSDYHIFYKMKMTRREVMNMYLSVIRECLETGISPRCHLEDITRSDIYGFVIPFCVELMKLQEEYKIPIKVRACDTMGYGVNFPGAVIPRSVPGIIYGLNTHAGVPSSQIEWHGHNDFYKAVNNSTTAWLYGASGVNCSLFGIGERTETHHLRLWYLSMHSLKAHSMEWIQRLSQSCQSTLRRSLDMCSRAVHLCRQKLQCDESRNPC